MRMHSFYSSPPPPRGTEGRAGAQYANVCRSLLNEGVPGFWGRNAIRAGPRRLAEAQPETALQGGFRTCSLKQCLLSAGEGRAAEIGSGYFLAKCCQVLRCSWGAEGGGEEVECLSLSQSASWGLSLPLISKPRSLLASSSGPH